MADKIVVEGALRKERGKNEARRIRLTGKVPAVLYGGKGESIALTVNTKQVGAILRSATGSNTLTVHLVGPDHQLGTGHVVAQVWTKSISAGEVDAMVKRRADAPPDPDFCATDMIPSPCTPHDRSGNATSSRSPSAPRLSLVT